MMVESAPDVHHDLGLSGGVGALPQWKRELLQRRAARTPPPPPPPAPPPPPPPPPADDDEELRYGPGIVKRLKSRYLSLALRDAPRRRPSVLRRAASLEHLIDEPPALAPRPRPHPHPAAAQPSRPLSELFNGSSKPPRRDFVKRARSVDALSRLEAGDEPPPPPARPVPPPPPAPAPVPRAARPPRRPAPLLRDAERPPADVVRTALRKFEAAPPRRAAPAARVSAVLRGLGQRITPPPSPAPAPTYAPPPAPPIRSSTPEPRGRSPSPAAADLSAIEESPRAGVAVRPVTRAALDNIARAGCTVRYAFEAPKNGSHLPPIAAANPVLLGWARGSPTARRVGVIRPMPATPSSPPVPTARRPTSTADGADPTVAHAKSETSSSTENGESFSSSSTSCKEGPPSAAVEPVPRSPPAAAEPLVNGHAEPPELPPAAGPPANGVLAPTDSPDGKRSRISSAKIERAWSRGGEGGAPAGSAWGARRGGGAALRPPAPCSTSVVFDFSGRKDVPDYIENDGVVRRAPRRDRLKAGDPGVVVLREGAGGDSASSSSEEEAEGGGGGARGPPSPCAVRFVNDNVLINGRSSMPTRPNPHRTAKLKLQFDDSLTRTFEYPSETSLGEDPPAAAAALADNTRIASAALSSYRPSKTTAATFQLGVTRAQSPPRAPAPASPAPADDGHDHEPDGEAAAAAAAARACGDDARSWSAARAQRTDLLF